VSKTKYKIEYPDIAGNPITGLFKQVQKQNFNINHIVNLDDK
jgi:hypothetical protein